MMLIGMTVRLANLMKVLTSDAIQDPTKVEARVRREVAIRKHNHEKMNTERKLTDDQRHEKIETKKVEEEKKGIYGAVFRLVKFCHFAFPCPNVVPCSVKNLSDPAQRFKVRKNAEQLKLTGVCLFNPSFTLVYVEGAIRFVRKYKHLMTNRIVWTEAARARGGDDVEIGEGEGEEGTKAAGAEDGSSSKPPGGTGEGDDEGGEPQNLEDNRCDLVWEGQLRDRAFGNFKPKACPTDHLARETLGPKLHGYWDMARNFKPVEDDFF
jgi:U4/U6 small nuclear ribonucleoprotein PRP3